MKKLTILDFWKKLTARNNEDGEMFVRRVRRSKREARALIARRGKSS